MLDSKENEDSLRNINEYTVFKYYLYMIGTQKVSIERKEKTQSVIQTQCVLRIHKLSTEVGLVKNAFYKLSTLETMGFYLIKAFKLQWK